MSLAATVICFAVAAPARAQQYSFRYYGTEEGLTSVAVKVLFQDRTGFLWVGTENGLFRYDGQRFQRYGSAEGLPSDVVLSVGEAPDGGLLAGYRAGLFEQKGQRFEKVPLPGALGIDGFNSILFDGIGRTFIATERGLVEATTPNAGAGPTLRLLPTPPAAGGPHAHGIFLEPGTVWFGCNTSVCRMSQAGVTVFGKPAGLAEGNWTSIRRDGSGDLWVHDSHKFAVLRHGSTRFDAFNPGFPQTASGRQMEVDSWGRLLVPTTEGLAINEGRRFRTVGVREGLRGPVYSVLRDREGSVWLGLAGRRLAKWRGYNKWEEFTADSGLDSELIYSILFPGNGTVLVGTADGLFTGRKTGDRWTWQRNSRVGRTSVVTLHLEQDRSIWVGTSDHGLARIDARTGRIEWLKQDRGLAGSVLFSMVIDRSRRVWVATERGLYVANLAEKRFRRVEEVPAVRCWAVTEGRDGEILVGATGGLYRMAGGRWRHITTADGLRNDVIMAVAATRSNEFWVGYWFSGSVTRVRVEGERLSMTHYGSELGLRGEMTYFLGFDARGQLWAGTDQGVRAFNGDRWEQYDHNDGLVWDDCDLEGFAAAPDGTVWIGTSGGLARFTPNPVIRQVRSPAVVFTQLTLGKTGVGKESHVSTTYASNSLTARYSALVFAHESSVLFRYRLLPLFGDWRETSQRELQFPGLPPDDYRLEVQAREGVDPWSNQSAVFAFRIRPPWWRTWWFCSFVTTAAVALLLLVWHWRVAQLMRRQNELERAVAERTRELHEQAVKDGLTGLFNRRAFFDILKREFARVERESGSLAFIMADLDLFKKINDTYGHMAGDAVLHECARRVSAWVRPYDTVGRYGGEEFVILVPGCGLEEAAERAEQVRRAIAQQPIVTPVGSISVTCSLGVSATTGLTTNPEELVQSADQALYCAKQRGRNCVVFFPAAADLLGVEEAHETR